LARQSFPLESGGEFLKAGKSFAREVLFPRLSEVSWNQADTNSVYANSSIFQRKLARFWRAVMTSDHFAIASITKRQNERWQPPPSKTVLAQIRRLHREGATLRGIC
jgi:hypothetical protein